MTALPGFNRMINILEGRGKANSPFLLVLLVFAVNTPNAHLTGYNDAATIGFVVVVVVVVIIVVSRGRGGSVGRFGSEHFDAITTHKTVERREGFFIRVECE
jgi:hypothetical protein